MIRTLFLSAGLVAVAAPLAAQVRADCAPRAAMIERLETSPSESRKGIGLAADGFVVEMFASDAEKKSWTLILTRPDGVSCVIARGTAYEALNDLVAPEGAPA